MLAITDREIPLEIIEYVKPAFNITIPRTREEFLNLLKKADIYINWFKQVTEKELEDTTLKLIIARSSGYDHIDTVGAEEKGICVANQPEIITEAVAEYTVAGIITALRRIVASHLYMDKWSSHGWPVHLNGRLLIGRTLGLLGAGRIAQSITRKLYNFGITRILYYSRSRKPCLESYYNARKVTLEELFNRSDILINTLPLTPETRGVVTIRLLSLLPRGAIYVNVGRGGTEEDDAVEKIMKERPDLSFFLDVHPEEPLPSNNYRIINSKIKPSIVLSPHRAGYSLESLYGTSLLALMQASDYVKHKCVWNPVNNACKQCPWGPPPVEDIVLILRQLGLID